MASLQNDAKLGMILCLIKSAVDADGNLLFDGDVDTAVTQLQGKALSGFSIVQDQVLLLNRLGVQPTDALEEAKNA